MSAKPEPCSIDPLIQFRMTLYLLFSRVFSRELDEPALHSIQQVVAGLEGVWNEIAPNQDPDLADGQSLLNDFFARTQSADRSHVLQQLARDYASLFLGVGAKNVSPCESVYRSRSELLCQSSHFEAQQTYRAIGMAKSDDFREPDDHIAVELSFMARLCELLLEFLEKDRTKSLLYARMQKEYLETHLLQWIPLFSKSLTASTGSLFYRGMAQLLSAQLRFDSELIETIIHELNPEKGDPKHE